jgi:dGTPase
LNSLRETAEYKETLTLCSFAAFSKEANNTRQKKEKECDVRTAFQRDCHRIVHSKAFRRLKGKTQVFLWPEGDHYRTRLTHCMEVSQIARTLARALDLNEDLTEAIALGHDLGHTPFGHAGEDTLQRLHPDGFRHEQQSLRVVEYIEKEGKGLNLTEAVKDGILNHSKGAGPILNIPRDALPKTLEGQLVRISDLIAYVNHDLDDAIRAKVLSEKDLRPFVNEVLGIDHSSRISRLVKDVVSNSNLKEDPVISMSREAAANLEAVRNFLYEKVYYNKTVHSEFEKASSLIERLWWYFNDDVDRFYEIYWPNALKDKNYMDNIRDFVAGMTDAFAINLHDKIFTPRRWYVR